MGRSSAERQFDGYFAENRGTLEDYLYKDERNNMSKVVNKDKKNAKLAKLEYEVLDYDEKRDLSTVKIKLHTGRHHQIRVQFASRGYSLYGDQRYGEENKKQLALFCYKLEFVHPVTRQKLSFISYPNYGIFKEFKECYNEI